MHVIVFKAPTLKNSIPISLLLPFSLKSWKYCWWWLLWGDLWRNQAGYLMSIPVQAQENVIPPFHLTAASEALPRTVPEIHLESLLHESFKRGPLLPNGDAKILIVPRSVTRTWKWMMECYRTWRFSLDALLSLRNLHIFVFSKQAILRKENALTHLAL